MRSEKLVIENSYSRYLVLRGVFEAADNANKHNHDIINGSVLRHNTRYLHYISSKVVRRGKDNFFPIFYKYFKITLFKFSLFTMACRKLQRVISRL